MVVSEMAMGLCPMSSQSGNGRATACNLATHGPFYDTGRAQRGQRAQRYGSRGWRDARQAQM